MTLREGQYEFGVRGSPHGDKDKGVQISDFRFQISPHGYKDKGVIRNKLEL